MKENALAWTIILTLLVGAGIASIGLYIWLDEVMKAYFFT